MKWLVFKALGKKNTAEAIKEVSGKGSVEATKDIVDFSADYIYEKD